MVICYIIMELKQGLSDNLLEGWGEGRWEGGSEDGGDTGVPMANSYYFPTSWTLKP